MNNLFHKKCQERETFHVEPTQADKISRGIVRDLTAIATLAFVLLVLGGWMPELWRVL